MDAKTILLKVLVLSKLLDARTAAALALQEVLVKRVSLTSAFDGQSKHLQTTEVPLFKALGFGIMRHFESLSATLAPLLEKPLRNKDKDIYALLLIGVFQLQYLNTPDYAAIDSCVKASKALKKPWAAGLINAVLRRYQAEQGRVLNNQQLSEHPLWLYNMLLAAWPEHAQAILTANNEEPPLCLRVNHRQYSRDDYMQELINNGISCSAGKHSLTSLYLHDKSHAIRELPHFSNGACSVQDEAPQLAAQLLDLAPHQTVLDACAAPGGKTCHILETEPLLASVIAVDLEPKRLARVSENLARLQLNAQCVAADITDVDAWWNGELFDRILCDVPCSATGVIRRHPDIKFLRLATDIEQLHLLQLSILQKLWPTLKPGGILLYATCSILPRENVDVIEAFCKDEPNCQHIPLALHCGIQQSFGTQLFPQSQGHDGFYYAKLQKLA